MLFSESGYIFSRSNTVLFSVESPAPLPNNHCNICSRFHFCKLFFPVSPSLLLSVKQGNYFKLTPNLFLTAIESCGVHSSCGICWRASHSRLMPLATANMLFWRLDKGTVRLDIEEIAHFLKIMWQFMLTEVELSYILPRGTWSRGVVVITSV